MAALLDVAAPLAASARRERRRRVACVQRSLASSAASNGTSSSSKDAPPPPALLPSRACFASSALVGCCALALCTAGGRDGSALVSRLTGCSLLVGSTALFTLGEAAFHGRLRSDTYVRLSAGVSASALATLLLAATASATPFRLASALVAAAVLFSAGPHAGGALPAVASALRPPSSPTAAAYLVLAVLCAAATALLASSPATKALGASGLVLCSVAVCLYDASQRGRLTASTFKVLNAAYGVALALAGLFVASSPAEALLQLKIRDARVSFAFGAASAVAASFVLHHAATAKK